MVFIIDKARHSQPARRDLYPRFVRPFATRLVDNFCLFEGKNHSQAVLSLYAFHLIKEWR